MFRYIADFENIWQQEAEKTLQILDAIPEAAAGTAVSPEDRDLRRLAWHLVETVVEMPGNLGLKVEGFAGEPFKTVPPESMKAIRDTFKAVSESLLTQVKGLNNAALGTNYPFYGMTWTGGFALFVLVTHQSHHRGQMTVLMRQAGLKVPGVYGPSRDDWAAYGMPVPTV